MGISNQKRLVVSLVIVLVWLSFVVEGSYALFSDKASLTGNSITTGSVDLQVSNSQNGSSTVFADTRPGFSYSMNPGESEERYFILKNMGTSGVSMDIDVLASVDTQPQDLLSSLSLEFTPVDSNGLPVGPSVAKSLQLMRGQVTSIGVPIDSGKAQRFKVKTTLGTNFAGQGQSITYDLMFDGTQHLVQQI